MRFLHRKREKDLDKRIAETRDNTLTEVYMQGYEIGAIDLFQALRHTYQYSNFWPEVEEYGRAYIKQLREDKAKKDEPTKEGVEART
jgi:hypothetical protein